MSTTTERILVTGASGFLGSHIVKELLNSGYLVRAVARSGKFASLVEAYKLHYGTNGPEVVQVDDLVSGIFPEIFKDVSALIHVASPLAGREGPDSIFASAVGATTNVLHQAEISGIKRAVITSSIATIVSKLISPDEDIKDTDWNEVGKEEAVSTGDKLRIYAASKTLAEKATWEFADSHPHVEVTTINPPFLYGPFAETQSFPKRDISSLSTNALIYQLLHPDGAFVPTADYVDVRDAARAHVLALKSPASAIVGRKRIPFASPHGLRYNEIRTYITGRRPELAERFTKQASPDLKRDRAPVDFGRIEQVLGMGKDDFYTVEGTFLEAIDRLVAIEAKWEVCEKL